MSGHDIDEHDFGRSPETLHATLMSSKFTADITGPVYARRWADRWGSQWPRFWLARFFLGAATLARCVGIYNDPSDLIDRALLADIGGLVILGSMTAIGLLILADVAVNDVPSRFSMPWTKEWRHIVYLALAFMVMALTFVVVRRVGYQPALLSFWVDATVATVVSALDLVARHREERT